MMAHLSTNETTSFNNPESDFYSGGNFPIFKEIRQIKHKTKQTSSRLKHPPKQTKQRKGKERKGNESKRNYRI